jgi:hypothetical protein
MVNRKPNYQEKLELVESTLHGWVKQEETLRGYVGSVVEGEALKKN